MGARPARLSGRARPAHSGAARGQRAARTRGTRGPAWCAAGRCGRHEGPAAGACDGQGTPPRIGRDTGGCSLRADTAALGRSACPWWARRRHRQSPTRRQGAPRRRAAPHTTFGLAEDAAGARSGGWDGRLPRATTARVHGGHGVRGVLCDGGGPLCAWRGSACVPTWRASET
jgi:hypothetical protein